MFIRCLLVRQRATSFFTPKLTCCTFGKIQTSKRIYTPFFIKLSLHFELIWPTRVQAEAASVNSLSPSLGRCLKSLKYFAKNWKVQTGPSMSDGCVGQIRRLERH